MISGGLNARWGMRSTSRSTDTSRSATEGTYSSKFGCRSSPSTASRNDIIPIELGRSVYEAAPGPKFWYRYPVASRNDCHVVGGATYFSKIAEFFLNGVRGGL